MQPGLRYFLVALYAVGPAVALVSLWRRGRPAPPAVARGTGWTALVPAVLLPAEWGLAPVLILTGLGDARVEWLFVRLTGVALAVAGAAGVAWSALCLGRYFVHEAAVYPDHALVTTGPYRLVRHPVYSAYLALLLGSGMAALNVAVLLLWPISLVGILVQARQEDRLLASRFGAAHEAYSARTGLLFPSFRAARYPPCVPPPDAPS
jgi:protein-S-isoprenylcysteine O-methyltransferase Ste14